MLASNIPVTIGHLAGGGANFDGQIEGVVVASKAWTPEQIRQAFEQQRG